MIVDIVDKYCTNDNNPIKNLRLNRVIRINRGAPAMGGTFTFIRVPASAATSYDIHKLHIIYRRPLTSRESVSNQAFLSVN